MYLEWIEELWLQDFSVYDCDEQQTLILPCKRFLLVSVDTLNFL